MPAPEIAFEALAKRWYFRFGFAALCALEEEFDQPFMEILARSFPDLLVGQVLDAGALVNAQMQVRLTDLRAILVAGLTEHHPDVTRAEVMRIVDDIGIDTAGDIVKRAVVAGAGGEKDDGANPRKRPSRRSASTPTGSSGRGAKRG